jgi:hypothetical protein
MTKPKKCAITERNEVIHAKYPVILGEAKDSPDYPIIVAANSRSPIPAVIPDLIGNPVLKRQMDTRFREYDNQLYRIEWIPVFTGITKFILAD